MSAGDRDTLTDEEREQINAAIRGGRGYYESTTRTHTAVESIVAARVRAAQAQAWDECCEAFAWAMKNEPNRAPVSWLAYVHENNPYRSDD